MQLQPTKIMVQMIVVQKGRKWEETDVRKQLAARAWRAEMV